MHSLHELDASVLLDTNADPETVAAAAITAAIVGFKIGGPFGALAGATFANHYGKYSTF